ncbi:methyltransferase-like protein 27, partial [Physella acuta]|uniref:methyltransferase-like protein 27 n=1 Tax=Physella acuta TaxID=109671 RepID=UPI0027DEA6B2
YGKKKAEYANAAHTLNYTGPQYVADMLAGLYPNHRDKVTILDMAAGTGFVGEELHKRGFVNIHAHEGSVEMLETSREKGVYSHFLLCLLTEENGLPLLSDTYDAISMSGGAAENHLPPCAQEELARVIKPGGYFVNSYRATLLASDYGKQWEEVAKKLEDNGKWKMYGRMTFRNYNVLTGGIVDIYKVL